MPGGKILGKNSDQHFELIYREEMKTTTQVIFYFNMMDSILESMSNGHYGGNNWDKKEKFANLKRMKNDFYKIREEFCSPVRSV